MPEFPEVSGMADTITRERGAPKRKKGDGPRKCKFNGLPLSPFEERLSHKIQTGYESSLEPLD